MTTHNSKYVEASEGKRWILTGIGLQTPFVREMFMQYPLYRHKVPAKWILNNYVTEVEED